MLAALRGTQHATVLGAQAFTSLIPFLVVGAVLALTLGATVLALGTLAVTIARA